ncbi:DUF481 domain-containing protein [Kordiimonas aquimaris]|uniref:DUF481 domain-containing protein n=1 Tax=Kordiimonas aquimaris TaxID=707591 RepID=UPI0021CFD2C2|nr:DUF481 domain-containing protein [Kordiimonas aquimaris]
MATGKTISLKKSLLAASLLATIGFGTVHAATPPGVEDMLKSAAEENRATFDIVLRLALDTWPDARLDILQTASAVRSEWLEAPQIEEIAVAEAAAVEAERKSRARGILYYLDPSLWNAQAQVGATSSTGDTDEQAVSAGLQFNRAFGERWEHNLNLDFDFARSNGFTTRRRLLTRFETLYKPWKQFYVLNYLEIDLNRFSGFDYRILDNVAIGAQLFKNDRQSLRLEGGPGVRLNKFEDTGATETEFLGRISSTYDLKLTDNINFNDRASVIFGTGSITFDNRAAVSAQINTSLSARLAFQVQYDSDAPLGSAAWDTLTRATLVYAF